MNRLIGYTAAAALAGVVGLSAGSASAVTTLCPGTAADTDREFGLDTTPESTCLLSGAGNINGNPTGGNADPFLTTFDGWMLADKSDQAGDMNEGQLILTGEGSTSGTFSFDPVEGFKYALGLKSGSGQLDPDWAVFGLNGATSGEWFIDNSAGQGDQALSHANLYKMPDGITAIPLPGALPLMIGALGGFGFLGWRRRQA